MLFDKDITSRNQKVTLELPYKIQLFLKREDELDSFVSGNKFRKLKYNLLEAKNLNKSTLITFGGAYSNHIAAVASAGKQLGFKTIGVIRGEELASEVLTNPTLNYAQDCGMEFKFVSREQYREKYSSAFIQSLTDKVENFYLIPEGGTNRLAVKGCVEILDNEDFAFDYIVTPVGTGGTIAGLIKGSKADQHILGFPALKEDFLDQEIRKFTSKENWSIVREYHFGGYAKVDKSLVTFMNQFYKDTGILLDPIYTGKMLFGILDLIKKGYFEEGSKILAIHTGGLQGINGMNQRLKKKNLPTINK